MYQISTEQVNNSQCCGSLGGDIVLPRGDSIPKCEECNNDMTLYFQIDVIPEMDLPFVVGSKFNVFNCIQCEDLPFDSYCGLDKRVKSTYDDIIHRHYSLMFLKPDKQEEIFWQESSIIFKPLYASESNENIRICEYFGKTSDYFDFKVGGVPSWINYSVNLRCTCGGQLEFLCQIPESYEFFYGEELSDSYSLFCANHIYFLACERQCSPYAMIMVLDN